MTTSDLHTYDRIRVMFPDYNGLPRGKYLPSHLAEQGTGHCATTWGLGYDRSMVPAPGSFLLEGLVDVHATLDPESLRPGWEDEQTAVAVADLALGHGPYVFAPRYALQLALEAWAEMGYQVNVGIELEAYLLQPDGRGGWAQYQNPRALVYGTGISNDPDGIINEIMNKARHSGFKLESVNAEFDESQYELTLEYGDALTVADEVFLFRIMAREVALAHGLDLTFLGKPFQGISGSGVHVNFSLVDDDGTNVFINEVEDDGLSNLAKGAIGGLCAHHEALTAICAPNVNAYRRLIPGDLAGYWANWGHDHRVVATRVPPSRGAATRIESRVADGAANIHLAIAAVLTAARLGVLSGDGAPEPETGDGFENVNTDVCAPANLSDGLDKLEADTAFTEALGSEIVSNFVFNKRAEWERFIAAEGTFDREAAATDWELNEYLPYH